MVQVKEKTLAAIGRWGVLLPPVLIVGGGGVAKFTDSALWNDQFVGWGYPAWMSPATGVLELLAAVGMLLPWTRFYGGALGTLVMLAAAGTRLVNGEYGFMAPPLIAAGLAGLTAWWARPAWLDAWLDRRAGAGDAGPDA